MLQANDKKRDIKEKKSSAQETPRSGQSRRKGSDASPRKGPHSRGSQQSAMGGGGAAAEYNFLLR